MHLGWGHSVKQSPKVGWSGVPGSVKFEVEVQSVYELLDVIRKKPGIYIGEPSLTALNHFIHGFAYALMATENPFDDEDPPFSGFHDWIASRFGFAQSTLGWTNMLLRSVGDETAAFERFFIELDEYRRSRTAS